MRKHKNIGEEIVNYQPGNMFPSPNLELRDKRQEVSLIISTFGCKKHMKYMPTFY